MCHRIPGIHERHLMGPPVVLGWMAVNLFWTRPALGGTKNDHRPGRSSQQDAGSGIGLDARDLVKYLIQRRSKTLVNFDRVFIIEAARYEVGGVPVTAHEFKQFFLRNSGKHGWIRDLVAVEVKNWQHDAVVHRVKKLV